MLDSFFVSIRWIVHFFLYSASRDRFDVISTYCSATSIQLYVMWLNIPYYLWVYVCKQLNQNWSILDFKIKCSHLKEHFELLSSIYLFDNLIANQHIYMEYFRAKNDWKSTITLKSIDANEWNIWNIISDRSAILSLIKIAFN